jgi:uncharacterized membrane protein YcfT
MTDNASPPDPRPRSGWADVAKGVCIILVVLWHVVTKHVQEVEWGSAAPVASSWAFVSAQFLPLRMPLFFLVSGLFAVRAVSAPDSSALWRRVTRLLLLYGLWLVIQTAALALLAPDFETARARSLLEFLANLTVNPTNLWYLQALAVYVLVARLVRRVPTAVVLGVAFLVSSIAGAGLLPDWGNFGQVIQNAFFFLLGLRGSARVTRAVAVGRGRHVVLAGAVFAVGVVVVGGLHVRGVFGVWPTLSLMAVAAGVGVCAILDRRVASVAAPLRWVGRRTLPIYVIHMIPLAVADRLLREWDVLPALPGAAVWEPVLLTIVVIAVSLGAHRLLVRVAHGVLFDPLVPAWRWSAEHR